MYNPSRGGVRGGADQFTWESVKNDKHRENYLGHSIMAPVGRWQKGKDLSWYAKERKDGGEGPSKLDKMELASIKRAEEEAMLIALGHNIVRKETQKLTKEEIQETLKRNTNQRDDQGFERVDGVGASSKRLAVLSNAGNDSKSKAGVAFEEYQERGSDVKDRKNGSSVEEKRKSQKKSKKHKKEKKHKKKHHKESYDSDSSENNLKNRSKHKRSDSDSDDRKLSSKARNHKKSKQKHRDYSFDDSEKRQHLNSRHESHKRNEQQSRSSDVKRRRHDTSESD